jgi:hypothetical protein
MDKLWPTLVVLAIVVLVFWAMWSGWRRRSRRDAALQPGYVAPAEAGATLESVDTFYVATTRHGQPLERVAVAPLGFRARAVTTIRSTGITISIPGGSDAFIPAHTITGVGEATWVIDRAVEQRGLVFVAWRTGSGDIVDSYFRVIDPAQRRGVIDAISTISAATAAGNSTESEA